MSIALSGQPQRDIPALALHLLQRDAKLLPVSVQRAAANWQERTVVKLMVRALSFSQPFMILSGPPQIGKTTAMYYAQGLTAARTAYDLLREQQAERAKQAEEYAHLRMLDSPPVFMQGQDTSKLAPAFIAMSQARLDRQWQMAREYKTPPPLGELVMGSLSKFRFVDPLRALDMSGEAWEHKEKWAQWSMYGGNLYIDELGDEAVSATARKGMASVLKARWDGKGRPLLAATNMTRAEFARAYGEAVRKRLEDTHGFVEVEA